MAGEVGTERPVRIPVARADLAAALDALLGNVFRHTPEGTAFAVDVHNGEDAVIVLVSDAGPGIRDPEAAMARGRGSGSAGSTGLGLDIVRRLAESTGGDVRIGSSVLGGTEVRIWIQLDGREPVRRGHRVPCGAERADWSRPLTDPDPFLKGALRSSTPVLIRLFARFRLASVPRHEHASAQGEW